MSDFVFHLVLFTVAGAAMVALPLTVGKLLRPKNPTAEKDAVYECGEPTIGSSFVQFDLRFYTVALLFIVFDVEVAFFFPWTAMYGNTMQLTDQDLSAEARLELSEKLLNIDQKTPEVHGHAIAQLDKTKLRQASEAVDAKRAGWQPLESPSKSATDKAKEAAAQAAESEEKRRHSEEIATLAEATNSDEEDVAARYVSAKYARSLGFLAFTDILVFFGVLLVGFAYVWKRGDLEWVRAIHSEG